jgi:serine/threonine protein kinase
VHNLQRKIFKLGDFGFARQLTNYKNKMMNSRVGTPLYMSPQLLEDKEYTSKSDIWSLALIYYQLIYHKSNFLFIDLSTVDWKKLVGTFRQHQRQTINLPKHGPNP